MENVRNKLTPASQELFESDPDMTDVIEEGIMRIFEVVERKGLSAEGRDGLESIVIELMDFMRE